MQEIWEKEARRGREELAEAYRLSLSRFGEGHHAAHLVEELEIEPTSQREARARANERLAEHRHHEALKRAQRERAERHASKAVLCKARERAVNIEKARSAVVVAQAGRSRQRSAGSDQTLGQPEYLRVESRPPRVAGAGIEAYADTHFHRQQAALLNASSRKTGTASQHTADANTAASEFTEKHEEEMRVRGSIQSRLGDLAEKRGRRAANKVRLLRVRQEVEGELTALERVELQRRKVELALPNTRAVQTQRKLEKASQRQQQLERAFEEIYFKETVGHPKSQQQLTTAATVADSQCVQIDAADGEILESMEFVPTHQFPITTMKPENVIQEAEPRVNISTSPNQQLNDFAVAAGIVAASVGTAELDLTVEMEESDPEAHDAECFVLEKQTVFENPYSQDCTSQSSDRFGPRVTDAIKLNEVDSDALYLDGQWEELLFQPSSAFDRSNNQSIAQSTTITDDFLQVSSTQDAQIDTFIGDEIVVEDIPENETKEHWDTSEVVEGVPEDGTEKDNRRIVMIKDTSNSRTEDHQAEVREFQGVTDPVEGHAQYQTSQVSSSQVVEVHGSISASNLGPTDDFQGLVSLPDNQPTFTPKTLLVECDGGESVEQNDDAYMMTLHNQIIEIEQTLDKTPWESKPTHISSVSSETNREVHEVPLSQSPVAPGTLHPIVTAHADDTSDEGLETALTNLLEKNSLNVGHLRIQRQLPSGHEERYEFKPTSNNEGHAEVARMDIGARDYRVSRLYEEHPHQDLHNLLPAWKSVDTENEFDKGESLQDAFRRHKQGFVRNSAERMQSVAHARKKGENEPHPLLQLGRRRNEERQRLRNSKSNTKATTKPGDNTMLSVDDIKPALAEAPARLLQKQPRLSRDAIKELNDRLYNKLCPEVRLRKENEAKQKVLESHKVKAQKYNEDLRRRQKLKREQKAKKL